jgi:putative sigma-54 modulation protein
MKIISTKATGMDMTDAIANYINEKLEAIEKLTQDFEPVAELMIDVGKSSKHHNKGPHCYAEMTLHVPGEVLRASTESEDLYACIDAVKDDLRRQLKDYKERLSDKSRKAKRPDKE